MIQIPDHRKIRIILCCDAKNEADDQYAIVHVLLTRRFCVRGMVAVHFREPGSHKRSLDEMIKLAALTGTLGSYPIVPGAGQKMDSTDVYECNPDTYEYSPGARLIVEEAMKEDPRPLYILKTGAVTDLAAAVARHPEISRRLTAIWVGGGRYPKGSSECNLKNDVTAARIVFASQVPLWQIPSNAYKTTRVSVAELKLRIEPMGELGGYLYRQLVEFANRYMEEKTWINPECWVLGDSGAVGVLLDEQKGYYREAEAPDFAPDCRYIPVPGRRKIRIYDRLDNRMILEDMFSKIKLYHLSAQ